jgi:uncharacterized membrane protein
VVDRDEREARASDFDLAGDVRSERAGELDRLVSLSDGVFAFALTLLIVSVEVPQMSDAEARDQLTRDILDLWLQVLSYFVGFLVIGFLWTSHRRIFARVRDYDDALTKLNIVLLMLVAFLPFPTGVLGEYGNLAFPSIFYALVLTAISTTFVLILDHLDRHRSLLSRDETGFDFARVKTRHLVTAGVFLLSIPVSLLAPGYSQAVWLLLPLNHRISERILPYLPARFRNQDHA